jgi:RNA polymerase sigma factor (sigma-70 family)
MQSIHWNIISRNIKADQELQGRLKIARLEKHLKVFAPERLHLQIRLEKEPKKQLYTAAMTLTTPADIFRVEKSAPELLKAFDDALHALERELENHNSTRIRERAEKRPETRERSRAAGPGIFTAEPQSEGAGPQNFQEVIRKFVRHHYHRLLHHARRDIRHDELTGDLPTGALDPRDVVDEVARQAEASANRKLDRVNWRVWIYHLLHEELRRQRRMLKQKQAEEVPTEKQTTIPELTMKALQPMEQMVEKVMEPQVIRIEDIVSNPEALPPDQFVEEKELLEELQDAVQKWPRPERDVFELYFVQGFEPEEIAQVSGQPLKKVKDTVATVQSHLRNEMLEEEAIV